jgi:hypothetical protein
VDGSDSPDLVNRQYANLKPHGRPERRHCACALRGLAAFGDKPAIDPYQRLALVAGPDPSSPARWALARQQSGQGGWGLTVSADQPRDEVD